MHKPQNNSKQKLASRRDWLTLLAASLWKVGRLSFHPNRPTNQPADTEGSELVSVACGFKMWTWWKLGQRGWGLQKKGGNLWLYFTRQDWRLVFWILVGSSWFHGEYIHIFFCQSWMMVDDLQALDANWNIMIKLSCERYAIRNGITYEIIAITNGSL